MKINYRRIELEIRDDMFDYKLTFSEYPSQKDREKYYILTIIAIGNKHTEISSETILYRDLKLKFESSELFLKLKEQYNIINK